jgi:WD40 repeat protein
MVGKMQYGNMPIFSCDTNKQIIVAGTNEDIIFWDVRNLKSPLDVLDESHNEDITAVKFHSQDYHKVISCSTDCLVNFFDFEGKSSMKEEECVEGTYCSEQPLIDCGFIPNSDKFYVLTSINTVEICLIETAAMFTRICKVSFFKTSK